MIQNCTDLTITCLHMLCSKMDPTTFLQAQSNEYQCHLSQLKDITTTVEHQLTIQSHKSIPKQYKPLYLKTSDPSLTEEFISNYNLLFFRHLGKVITNNQIKLELHKSTLTSIIIQTEVYLSKLPSTPEQITDLYNKFRQDNGIADRIPIPELQGKLKLTHGDTPQSITSKRRKRGQKRKCTTQPPPPTKQARQNHFLSPSFQQTQLPP